ncbi:hypothetical protein G3567_05400 [Psychroflexus sp. YR1-1]|uniref:DoxX-like family protein n=1 Tax=Psychroflexus aurantiacus TaxID=2709310 RepID=A0A6B3R3A7_9FLAO|nr:MauE/DoxX family redox-associated membrane protein [Psychroflexus aurantiacus]NEV93587.1 hypothetical protein [Psychroflexus aurantiacus]
MKWDLLVMSIIYVFAGSMHFIKPRAYVKIIPKFLPKRRTLNLFAGAVEIMAGFALLFPETRPYAAILIITMLVVFLVVHFNMLRSKELALGVPRWILILRIPLQFLLIWWASLYI